MTIEKELSKVDGWLRVPGRHWGSRQFVFFPIQLSVYKYRGRNMMATVGLYILGSLNAKSHNCGPLDEKQGVT